MHTAELDMLPLICTKGMAAVAAAAAAQVMVAEMVAAVVMVVAVVAVAVVAEGGPAGHVVQCSAH